MEDCDEFEALSQKLPVCKWNLKVAWNLIEARNSSVSFFFRGEIYLYGGRVADGRLNDLNKYCLGLFKKRIKKYYIFSHFLLNKKKSCGLF